MSLALFLYSYILCLNAEIKKSWSNMLKILFRKFFKKPKKSFSIPKKIIRYKMPTTSCLHIAKYYVSHMLYIENCCS